MNNQHNLYRQFFNHTGYFGGSLLVGFLIVATMWYSPALASAQAEPAPVAKLRVTVERVRALDCFDTIDTPLGDVCDPLNGEADFYGVVTLGDERLPRSSYIDDKNSVNPNWEFSKQIELGAAPYTAKIQIYDKDKPFGPIENDDDEADLDHGNDRAINLSINLMACLTGGAEAISGDFGSNHKCDETIVSSGDGKKRAEIQFRVVVEPPPSTPGTNVRCLHDPIWPQATDTVTINVEALDGALQPKALGVEIEVWLNDKQQPYALSQGNQSNFTATAGPFPEGSNFAYGCLVRDLITGETAWTGWRVTQVGLPTTEHAIPIVYTGPRSSRLDLLFVADAPTYGDPKAVQFRQDVAGIMREGFYAESIYLENQDKFNFWIARDAGVAREYGSEKCNHEIYGQVGSVKPSFYQFADAAGIVNRRSELIGRFFRDCSKSSRRIFSADVARWGYRAVVLHETGHALFGLADEYCCDGGYFQTEQLPNVYDELATCTGDLANLREWDSKLGQAPRGDDACRKFDEDLGWFEDIFVDGKWFVSDPPADDLMVDSKRINGADARRIYWALEHCDSARCGPELSAANVTPPTESANTDPRTDPIPDLDFAEQAAAKSVVLELRTTGREAYEVVSSQVVTGQSYATFADPPLMGIEVVGDDATGRLPFNAWPPMWVHTWSETGDRVELLPESEATIAIPFAPALNTVEITDLGLRKVVANIDIKPAIDTYCGANVTDVDCATDIALAILPPEALVVAGSTHTYTITVTNLGHVAANIVTLHLALPQGVILAKDQAPPSCTEADGTVTCVLERVAHLSQATLTIPITVDALSPERVEFTITGQVVGQQADPDLANNVAVVTTRVARSGDLAVELQAPAEPLLTSKPARVNVLVQNDGTSVLTGAKLVIVMPPGISQVAWLPPAQCQSTAANIECLLGTLLDHSVTLITLDLQIAGPPQQPGDLTVTAHISANEADPYPANNTASTGLLGWLGFLPSIQNRAMPPDNGLSDLVIDALQIGPDGVVVTVRNIGATPILPSNSFWIDLYIGPTVAPVRVNQVWQDLGEYGLVWGVKSGALRLLPGETLRLTLGDPYAYADLSHIPATIMTGTHVYAQVDSANLETDYGAVWEVHEKNKGTYNNITEVVVATTFSTAHWQGVLETGSRAAGEVPATMDVRRPIK